MAAVIFLSLLYFAIPIALARFIVRANWREIGSAYGVLIGIMILSGFTGIGGRLEETFGWAIILAMFYTIPVIPTLSLIVRLTGRFR